MIKLPTLLTLLALSLALLGCDRIPEEGTIVYDVDFPRIQALGDQLLIATTKTCIYVGKFFLASSSFQIY